MLRAIGIDASWTGFAIVSYSVDEDGGERVVHSRWVSKPSPEIPQAERMDTLVREAMEFVLGENVTGTTTAIAVEGYAFGAKNGRESSGELGGFLRWNLWRAGLDARVVPPTTVKKFLTGSGGTKKDEMMMACLKRFGFESPNNDVCDAYVLARFAWDLATKRTKTMEELAAKTELLRGRGSTALSADSGKPKRPKKSAKRAKTDVQE